MSHKTLTQADLRQFIGTEQWYRHPFIRRVLYTDGVQYVAETGGAYWLIDAIACAQVEHKAVAAEPFQLWVLTVQADHTAILTCNNGDNHEVFRQELDYTDFPLETIRFYFTDNVILLPSEY